MLKVFNTVQVICDDENPIDHNECWDEITLTLDPGETKKDAIEFLEKMGWNIEQTTEKVNDSPQLTIMTYKVTCPYCYSGITKEEVERRMEEE